MTFGCSVNSGAAFTMPNTRPNRTADLVSQGRQQLQADIARMLRGLLDGDVASDLALRPGSVGIYRSGPGEEDDVAEACGGM